MGIDTVLDYPCTLELPADAIDTAGQALRSEATLFRSLRLRIADLETRLGDFTGNNRHVFQGLQDVAGTRR